MRQKIKYDRSIQIGDLERTGCVAGSGFQKFEQKPERIPVCRDGSRAHLLVSAEMLRKKVLHHRREGV